MITLLKIAYRDLGRNRRRTFLSCLALGVGVALLLMMAAVFTGEMRDSMDVSIRLQSGHLQLRAPSYDEAKTSLEWNDLVADPDKLAAQIAALPGVVAATPRLYASGIVSSSDDTMGVRIIGIEPASAANAPFRDGLLSGKFLSADDTSGILIGRRLAQKLNLQVDSQLALLANTSNGDVAQQNFTVRGIYSTTSATYDEGIVFLPLAKAQALTSTQGHASLLFILLQNSEQTPAVAAALKTSYKLLTFEDMNEMLVQLSKMSDAFLFVLYLIILAIVVTVIVNTLVMSVFERTREIGILAAIGMKGRRIMLMFFLEAALMALGGILIGLVLGGLVSWYTAAYGIPIDTAKFGLTTTGFLFKDHLYGYLTVKDTITLSLTALGVTLVAAIYPAQLAAKMEPVEALHGGS